MPSEQRKDNWVAVLSSDLKTQFRAVSRALESPRAKGAWPHHATSSEAGKEEKRNADPTRSTKVHL
ncbi:uncharacterized protein LOC144096761 [Amblyomma americanum]